MTPDTKLSNILGNINITKARDPFIYGLKGLIRSVRD